MDISDYLQPNRIFINQNFSIKRHLFESISDHGTDVADTNKMTILNRLMERERLGATHIGEGCAIPHISIESKELKNSDKEVYGFLFLMTNSIDYDPPYNQDADIIFFLIGIKSKKSRQALELARFRLKSPCIREKLRKAKSPLEAYNVISGPIECQERKSDRFETMNHFLTQEEDNLLVEL